MTVKRILGLLGAAILFGNMMAAAEGRVSVSPSGAEAEAPAESAVSESGIEDVISYEEYRAAQKGGSAQAEITLDLNAYRSDMEDISAQDGGLYTAESGYVEWTFSAEQEGFYRICVSYLPVAGSGRVIVRDVLLDGALPFREAYQVEFERVYSNETAADGAFAVDSAGNQIRPRQVENPKRLTKYIQDPAGFAGKALELYLTPGEHTLRLVSQYEPLLLYSIRLVGAKDAESYDTVLAGWQATGAPVADTVRLVEAEQADYKSDRTLYPMSDRVSAGVSPYHYRKVLYNILGGENWNSPGQWVEWEVEVEETALYTIALKYRQSLKNNDVSSRTLYIDGEVPFAEVENIEFPYDGQWNMLRLGESEERPGGFLFYLTKGKHTFRLEAGMGQYTELIQRADKILSELNTIYRKVIMITSPQPDGNRDYQFDKLIPDVIRNMSAQAELLTELEADIQSVTRGGGQSTAAIHRLTLQLRAMAEDPETIAFTILDYKTNVSSFSTWITETREQPLELDYWLLCGPDSKLPKANGSFWEGLKHTTLQFFSSFVTDYSAVGVTDTDADRSITVWTSGGRDQAQILKQLINEDFSGSRGINVNLQLVAGGSLLPATLAGIGPDVSLGMVQADPMNYAFRHAVCDLSGFSGAEEVMARFHPSALTPFRYGDALYAIPETQSFPMLFYRKDILDEMEIPLTELETWDGLLLSALPKIQKSYLQLGLASGCNTFLMFLLQNGGELYSEDLKSCLGNSPEGIRAFETYTELYSDYKQPLSFDFANRFRSGEIPLAIVDFTAYNQLSIFAPEIKGLWGMKPLPYTVREDGTRDRTAIGTVTASVIMSQAKDPEGAWEFIRWFSSAETQAAYGNELESVMGTAARYATANREAMQQIRWDRNIAQALQTQWESVRTVPEVPGGYFTSRYLDFAFRDVVYNGKDIRETLNSAVMTINEEIRSKRQEFKLD